MPSTTLKKLLDGNKRFAECKSIHPNLAAEQRSALVDEQKPFAAIVACSDSRVPVEIIFDVGIGDLFVIRTAGHVLSKETLGSLEYAVAKLNVNFIMILGHDNCGAVNSAIKTHNIHLENKLSDNMQTLLGHIYPVLDELKKKGELCPECAIRENIKYQVNDLLKRDSYLAKKHNEGEILVVGAKYNLSTGLIEIVEDEK